MQMQFDFEQPAQLARVAGKTAAVIIEFFSTLSVGQDFHADELRQFVAQRLTVAPGSPDRIMRELRRHGEVSYQVVNRAKSLYRKTQCE
jgi:hypothetical protein